MATTGIIKGRNLALLWNGTQITHLTSANLTLGTETIDLTSYDSSGWKDMTVGDKSWSLDFEAFVAYDATEGYDELMVDWNADASGTALLSTQVTGDSTVTGTAYITALNKQGAQADAVKMTGTLTGTGSLTIGTVA